VPSRSTDGQERIGGDKVGEGNLEGQSCNWCSAPATHALPVMRKQKGARAGAVLPTGMHIYTCDEHKEVGERSNKVRNAL
jgi:hypothetical protein